MKIEPVTREMVFSLIAVVGSMSATISGLFDVDLGRGRGALDDTGRKHCLWTKDGRRIDVTVCADGGVIVSRSKEPEEPCSK